MSIVEMTRSIVNVNSKQDVISDGVSPETQSYSGVCGKM